MKASTERGIIRWIHIILSIPLIGYIYGPVAQIPQAAWSVRFIFMPIIIISGLWLWKGHWVKNRFVRKTLQTERRQAVKGPVRRRN